MKQILLLFFALALVFQVYAQMEVTGTVASDDGETLPGASVLETGTTNGTITNVDGEFTLSVGEGASLTVSFVGYESIEIPINGRTTININLTTDISSLEEVVVVGYGTQDRSDVTGAVSTVDQRALENRTSASMENLLQGTASGIQVVAGSGQPGAPATIRIRGAGSFSAGNDPLYVVDGVPIISNTTSLAGGQTSPMNPLADINPNDIENISILKDASAAAIYGSRASNGVILITTKRGKQGQAQFNVNVYTGTQRVIRQMPTLSPREQRDLFVEKWVYGRGTLDETINKVPSDRYRPEAVDTLNPGMGLIGTDWQDEVFDWAPITKADISVSGGSEKLKYALSGEYFDQRGVLINSGFRRLSTRMNAELLATNWLKIGNNFSYSNTNSDRTREDNGGQTTWYYWFNSPGYTANRDPVTGLLAQRHPTNVLNEQVISGYTNRIFGNIYAEAKILDGLTFRSNIAIDVFNQSENGFFPSTVNNVKGFRYVFDGSNTISRWVNENYFTYTKSIGDHNFTALLGSSLQSQVIRSNLVEGSDGSSDKITTVSGAGTILASSTSDETGYNLLSYYSRLRYSFKNKYLISASIRRDGSSKFGENNRYAVFPSVSGGWVISEESFFGVGNFVSNLKLRAAYGETGNQEGLGNFTALGIVQTGFNYAGGAGTGPTSAGIPNSTLKWETSKQTDIGIDMGLLEGRFGASFSWYNKVTEDLLFGKPLPETSGYNSIISNIGSIRNTGVDIELTGYILTGDISWNISGNISFLDNEVLALSGEEDETIISGGGSAQITEVGQKLGNLYGYNFLGVYATDADVPAGAGENGKLSTTDITDEFRMGTPIIQDLNEDGQITADDRMILGNAIADYTGGVTSRMGYKGFEFNVLLTYSVGNMIWHVDRAARDSHGGVYRSSTPEAWHNRWQQEGDDTSWPLVTQGNRTQVLDAYQSSTQFLEDGSFLKLRNITLAYNLNSVLLEKINLRSVRVYFTGENLRTFTKYTGYDPEMVGIGNPLSMGQQTRRLPTSLSMIMGINIGI